MNQVVCNKKDECTFKGCTSATEHRHSNICDIPCAGRSGVKGALCLPVPTDLTYPLRPPRGPKSYVCNEAGECGIAECTAAEAHTHNEPPLHGPRQCGFARQVVSCKEVPELVKCDTTGECGHECYAKESHDPLHLRATRSCTDRHRCDWTGGLVRCNPLPTTEPLRGVWVSGKALEVLSQYHGWSNDKWDAFWDTVTGKTTRHTDAKRVMAEANGPEDTIRNLGANDHERDLRRIVISTLAKWDKRPRPALGSVVNEAVTRIVELQRPLTP